MGMSLIFLFIAYFSFFAWPIKYQVMTYLGLFYGTGPLLLYGLYAGGLKRIVAGVFSLLILAYIAFYASQIEKGDILSKFSESFGMIRDQGHFYMIG